MLYELDNPEFAHITKLFWQIIIYYIPVKSYYTNTNIKTVQ